MRIRTIVIALILFLSTAARGMPNPGSGATPTLSPSDAGGAAAKRAPLAFPTPDRPTEPLLETPVDADRYLLGPGDILGLTVQGAISRADELPVTPEGIVQVPGAGQVRVAGLSLTQGRDVIRREVLRAFRNVEVSVTLVRLRTFVVHVLGEVAQPGQFEMSAVDRVSEAVARAGGMLPTASQRLIQVQRRDGSRLRCDLLRFRRTGDLESDPTLQGGDVVFVGFKNEGILLNGEVEVPGPYEFVEGDTLGEIIALAGGLTERALLDTVEIGRYTEGSEIPRLIALAPDGNDGDASVLRFPLQMRDAIMIRTRPNWDVRKTVTVEGEVVYPGTYVIREDHTTLTELIRRAGGFTANASLREATLVRATNQTAKDPEFERLRSMTPADMSRDEYEYFKMRSRQRGGLMTVEFARLFEQHDSTEDALLKDGDVITVPMRKGYVTMAGQVAFPGNIAYEPGLRVEDYIARAGGYGWQAARSRTKVIRASTGEWVARSRAGNLGPGDTIWVPEKADRKWYSTFKDALVTASQIATIYLVIRTATK